MSNLSYKRRLLYLFVVTLTMVMLPKILSSGDQADPFGTVIFTPKFPTGNNAEMTLKGTDYERNLFVYVGRFGLYVDGGGFEPTKDGIGKMKKRTRVLLNEKTRFGFEVGVDGLPETYLLDNKPVKKLIVSGRYVYLAAHPMNSWYDIQTGEKIEITAAKPLTVVMKDSGKKIKMPLSDFVNGYQKALDEMYAHEPGYKCDKLAAAISYHSTRKTQTK